MFLQKKNWMWAEQMVHEELIVSHKLYARNIFFKVSDNDNQKENYNV